jgi:penicillin-binding protein 2
MTDVRSDRAPSMARLSMVGIVCLSLFASLFARLWYLQVIDKSEHVRAVQIHKRTVRVEGTRGRILDVNGKVLVDNQITRVIGIDRQQVKDKTPEGRAKMFDALAAALTSFGIPTKSPAIAEKYDDLRYGPLDLVPIVTDLQNRDLEVYLAEHHDEFPGVVVLEIDQDVQAVVVKSVFQTAAFAGYPRVSFMVNKAASH